MRQLLDAAGGLEALALYFGDDSDGGDAGQLGARWVIVSGVADDGRGG